jgi:hypothetical protein
MARKSYRQRWVEMLFLIGAASLVATTDAWAMATRETQATSAEYQERPVLETSVFESDKTVLDEQAIQRVLTSRFELPAIIKIALFRMPESQQHAVRYYGYGYWRSEEYLKVQQEFVETITGAVAESPRVLEVALLPSLLTPQEPTIPVIREMAVRLQADMLMVFRVSSDVYEKYRVFQSEQAKAYSTCEGFLLDVRTGLIPFSRIITKDYLATKEKRDANFKGTMARAEKEAAILALAALGTGVVEFLGNVTEAARGD